MQQEHGPVNRVNCICPIRHEPKEFHVIRTLAAISLVLGSMSVLGQAQANEGFESVKVFLERNVMDKDAEVRFEATGGPSGLTTLKIVSPDGRTVIDFKAAASKLGMRSLSFESPEPTLDKVLADFPAGTYTFTADTTSGGKLQGKAALSHTFPDTTSLIAPRPDAQGVSVNGLQISWQPVKGLDAVIVVVEHEGTGRVIRSNLPGHATRLAVPDGFLQPGTEYKLAIGTVAKDGNSSFIEASFTTAKK